jgi:hypothetical protein
VTEFKHNEVGAVFLDYADFKTVGDVCHGVAFAGKIAGLGAFLDESVGLDPEIFN